MKKYGFDNCNTRAEELLRAIFSALLDANRLLAIAAFFFQIKISPDKGILNKNISLLKKTLNPHLTELILEVQNIIKTLKIHQQNSRGRQVERSE